MVAHLPRSVSSTKRLLSVCACYVFLVRVYYLIFSSTCLCQTLSVSCTNCLLVLVRISACCVFLVRVYCLMFSST